MQFFITLPSIKTLTIEVSPEQTIGELKALLVEQSGYPVTEQRLIFCGDELTDNLRTVASHGFSKGTPFHLVRKPFDMSLLIQQESGKTITINIYSDKTIADLKQLVATKSGIAVLDQRILFGGKEPDNSKKISYYSIEEGSVLHLFKKTLSRDMPFFIKLASGKTISTTIHSEKTFTDLKQQIAEESGLAVLEQRIMFCGQETVDSRKVGSYPFEKESVLHLLKKPSVINDNQEQSGVVAQSVFHRKPAVLPTKPPKEEDDNTCSIQ